MSYRYYSGPDGMRCCYAVPPTYECPLSKSLWDVFQFGAGGVDGPVFVRTVERRAGEQVGITYRRHVTEAQRRAAAELAMDPVKLADVIVQAHRGKNGRARVGDRLTEQCVCCGARMERLGFRCWIERPPTEEEEADRGASAVLNRRLGFGPMMVTVKSIYVDTKKEAREWAYEESRIARAVAADA